MPRSRRQPPKKPGTAPTQDDLLQFYLRNREAFDKRIDADVERSCTSKNAYPTPEHARAVAAMNRMSDILSVYHCTYCRMYHLTRRAMAPPQIIDE